jgi:hypothetical protein
MLKRTRMYRVLKALHDLNREKLLDIAIDERILWQIAEYNREQLSKGERSDGSSLPDYSQTSVEMFGKEQGAIKLYDTGDFYNSIEAKVVNDVIAILSSPLKRDSVSGNITNLKQKYENEIIGINEENLQKIREQVKQNVVKYIFEVLRKS